MCLGAPTHSHPHSGSPSTLPSAWNTVLVWYLAGSPGDGRRAPL